MQLFDGFGDEDVESARKWLRLDCGYRSAITALASDNDRPSV
jgi:hypothetical protein